MNNQVLVSVCCITYNQEKFIKEAIEGFLTQKTNFEFEILIHDDASTDSTTEIVRDYAQKYPKLIKPIYQSENQGSKKEGSIYARFVFPNSKGKYISICEGDDYWIDPYKLQKQVDFLEANFDYGMICTDYNKLLMKNGKIKKNCFPKKYINSGYVEFEQYLLDRTTIGTATVLLRKDLFLKFIDDIGLKQLLSWGALDTPLWLYISLKSKIKVLKDITSVYRINLNSASKFTNVHKRFNFQLKGFEVPMYFLDNFSDSCDLKKEIEIKYLRTFLHYRYESKNNELGIEQFEQLNKLTVCNWEDYLLFYLWKYHFIVDKFLLYIAKFQKKILNKISKSS